MKGSNPRTRLYDIKFLYTENRDCIPARDVHTVNPLAVTMQPKRRYKIYRQLRALITASYRRYKLYRQ